MNVLTNIPLPHSVRFAEKWIEWINYRKTIKKSYKTQKGVTMALNQLKAVSESEAIEMIDSSMRNEYQGLFAQKKEKSKYLEETPKTYKFQDIRTKSDYEPPEYPRSKGIEHMREKLKKNYESGSYIKDYGGIYSTLLAHKAGYSLSGDKINEIHKEVREEATRKRNRFEEQYTGSIESDIRDKCLNLWLDNCRANNRDVSKEI